MTTKIAIGGQTLIAGREMPVELQQQLEQLVRNVAEENGQPAAGIFDPVNATAIKVATAQQFVINGHRYRSLDEMPPAERKVFEQARNLLLNQAFRGEALAGTTENPPGLLLTSDATPRQPMSSADVLASSPTLFSPGHEESELGWLVHLFVLLLGIVIGLALAAAVWSALK